MNDKQADQDPMVQFTVLIPPDHLKKIGSIAKDEIRTKGYVVREAITRYLNDRKRRGKSA